jgi:nucleoside 2-deoxyribosyltransferase
MKVYLAAALARARFVEAVAAGLRGTYDVVSGWHSRHNGSSRDPRDDDERTEICSTNLAELVGADVAVVMVDDGEPRATYGELGFALALCKPCVFVHDSGTGRCILDSHSLVVRLDLRTHSLEDLPRVIDLAAGLVEPTVGERITLPCPEPTAETA